MNIKKISIILLLFGVFLCLSTAYAVSLADLATNDGKNVYDAQVKGGNTIVVNVNEKINFALSTRYTDSVEWNWGDGTPIQTTKTKVQKADVVKLSHKFTKTGKYIVKINQIVNYNGPLDGLGSNNSINVQTPYVYAVVYVVKKPDLYYTNVKRNVDNKGIVRTITLGVKNKGAKNAPKSYVLIKYNDPKVNKYAAIFKNKKKRDKYLKKYKNNKKKYKTAYNKLKKYYNLKKELNKYTTKVKIKALKSGKSTVITLNFKIPKKYKKYRKTIILNYGNKFKESITSNNIFSFY
jgi:uncharacterized protein (DUF2141 family)